MDHLTRATELLDEFASGAMSLDELERTLRAEPGVVPEVYALAMQRHRSGALSDELLAALEARRASLAAAASSAPPPADGTRIRSPGREPADGTRIRSPAREPADVGTRIRSSAREPAQVDVGTRIRSPRQGADEAAAGPPPASRPEARAPAAEPPLDKELRPGLVIKDRFLLLEQIGAGGMGVVFKARDQEYEGHEQLVALKFLGGELQGRPDALRALEEEVRKTHDLAHPNIVTVYDFYRDPPFHFISMEFLEGETLDQFLRRVPPEGLPFDAAWRIVEGAATALAYAHQQGIVHSDFKPGNVFLTRDDRVKVLDFGIARAARAEASDLDTSASGLIALTPAYASPEMVLNLEPDPRDDVYALACVAYELLSGRHPFDRKPAHRAQHAGMRVPEIKGMPRARMRALRRGLAFTRDARTPSVQDFLTELRAAPQRGRLLRVGGGAALGVLAVAGVAGYVYSSQQRCANIDASFLQSLRPAAPAEAIDPSYRDLLIEQGQEYLALAREEFSPSLLTEGVSDAFGAFTGALRIDPENRTALDGIMEVIALYEAEARRLLDLGNAAESAAVADYGLKVHSLHCGLTDVRRRAAALLE